MHGVMTRCSAARKRAPSTRIPEDAGSSGASVGHVVVLVDVEVAAVRGARLGMLPQAVVDRAVETVQHEVVAVQHVDELSARSLQAGVEVADDADVLGLAMELHASLTEPRNHFLRIVVRRVVVDDLDLHRLASGILREH